VDYINILCSIHSFVISKERRNKMSNNYVQEIEQFGGRESGFNPSTGTWEVIVKYNGDILKLEEKLGVQIEILGDDFAIISLQREQISHLYDFKEIMYIEIPRALTLVLNQNLRIACISEVHRPDGFHLTGQGMLIGIIDSGIDYTHSDFRNQDGTSRILYIWDQTVEGNPPQGFRQGTEYNNEQLNMALNSDQPFEVVTSRDEVGHGTAVAGIAAGNGSASGGQEMGAAPESSLIIVKLGYKGFESFARTTEIMRALKYIMDKAEELGMPVAVNISFGTNDGSHDGSSLFETYINAASQRWKNVIVTAAGNEGGEGHHYAGKIALYQTMDVNFVVAGYLSSMYLVFWKSFVDRFALELILPSGASTGEIYPSDQLTLKNIDGISIQIYYGQPTHYNEDQEIYFSFSQEESFIPQGIWRLRVRALEVVDGRFDIWLPTVEEVGSDTAFTEPSVDTTITIPSTAANVITVGGYNGAIYAAANFSGRGFTRNNIYIKPDLVAPAVGILSARAGGGYDSFTGTSMAAPFVTGAAALMMQWGIVLGNDHFLYGQRVKAFLKKGASREDMISYPNAIWGYGALCLKDTMDYLQQYK